MNAVELTRLLGERRDDFDVRRFLRDLYCEPRVLEEEDRTYYEFLGAGVSLLFDAEDRLRAIHLYSEGRDDYREYRGPLPCGISFSDEKSKVVETLGHPSRVGGGSTSILYTAVPQWIRYDYPDYSLHAEFAPQTARLSLVTLISHDTVSWDTKGAEATPSVPGGE